MSGSSFVIRVADWARDAAAIRAIREAVFVSEQAVPEELEWDGLDPASMHILAHDDNGAAVATARMLADGKIGRMAVVRAWRGRGVGTAMLRFLLEAARGRGLSSVTLDAQVRALDFYRRLGFRVVSDQFMDAGIPHRRMMRELTNS